MKKAQGMFVVIIGIATCGGTAFAQDPETPLEHGAVEFGLRVGYGFPVGKEGATYGMPNANVSDDVSGVIPIVIDAGYRFNPNVYLGLSFRYAPGIVNTNNNATCNMAGVSCSASDLGLGLNLHYHFAPGQSFDPWLGIGAGYEWLDLSVSANGASGDVTGSGFEFANLQLGGDIAVAPNFALGPFASVSFGQYQGLSVSAPTYSMDMTLTTKSVHEWIMFGLRGVYDIPISRGGN